MRSKTKDKIAVCVEILNLKGGTDALNQRLAMVKNRIVRLKSEVEPFERKRTRIYGRIVELEMERDIIEQRLAADTKCACCNGIIEIPYKTPLMEGKVFCSRECALSELEKTIKEGVK